MASSSSRLEALPIELLHKIISDLKAPSPKINVSRHLRDMLPNTPTGDNTLLTSQRSLRSCLATSRALRSATLPVLYRKVQLSKASSVTDFNAQLERNPHLGKLVLELDLSGLAAHSATWQEDSATLIIRWLALMPRLQSIKTPTAWTSENYSNPQCNLDLHILKRLLRNQLPNLRSLEWGPTVVPEFEHFLTHYSEGVKTGVTNLVARSTDVEMTSIVTGLLKIMPRIQHIDLTTSNVFIVEALAGLQENAKLLSLRTSIKPSFACVDLVEFMSSNPEMFESLLMLDLEGDDNEILRLESTEDITKLITQLPASLRSLNLEGFATCPAHLQLLQKHCPQLEELSFENGIQLEDLEHMILPPHTITGETQHSPATSDDIIDVKHQTVLEPMAKAVAVCKLRRRINSVTLDTERRKAPSCIKHLRIRMMPSGEQRKLRTSVLLGGFAGGLESIQIAGKQGGDGMVDVLCKAVGWRCVRRGRECWVERV
ncbi:hypothetical protein GLAREA_03595 [Glarea lozoyensis ATCC 20868]|uniref:F-box domain-containing protein n=1 Tax=Glarea lozoyensis (strain ATCC 20868 / MF5171) TaxID=1116229 RepID=S3DW59_GLAL2|nr:uncharacterized protein GLAREA_03595 [Glarea lozoyensis ATCC 20868]EPE30628.1 hypothetical protein GLAREA_03595 [Glarea lozoyensis ATCC 20868]